MLKVLVVIGIIVGRSISFSEGLARLGTILQGMCSGDGRHTPTLPMLIASKPGLGIIPASGESRDLLSKRLQNKP